MIIIPCYDSHLSYDMCGRLLGATTFPTRINPLLISIASIANQLKWITFAFGLLLLVGLFVRTMILNTATNCIRSDTI